MNVVFGGLCLSSLARTPLVGTKLAATPVAACPNSPNVRRMFPSTIASSSEDSAARLTKTSGIVVTDFTP